MTENRYGNLPLGKSVEEVSAESGESVTASETSEALSANDVGVIPVALNNMTSGTPLAVVNPAALIEGGNGVQHASASLESGDTNDH